MTPKKNVSIRFDATVSLEQRGNQWAGHIQPFGMTVYGKTQADVEKRVQEGIDFILVHTPDVPKYLDSHNVPHDVHYITVDYGTGTVRRTYPVVAQVESPVYA